MELRYGLTVGQSKVVGSDGNGTSLKVVPIDLVTETRRRAEILEEAVESVGEVELLVAGMDDNVVEGAELTTEVIVQKDLVIVSR